MEFVWSEFVGQVTVLSEMSLCRPPVEDTIWAWDGRTWLIFSGLSGWFGKEYGTSLCAISQVGHVNSGDMGQSKQTKILLTYSQQSQWLFSLNDNSGFWWMGEVIILTPFGMATLDYHEWELYTSCGQAYLFKLVAVSTFTNWTCPLSWQPAGETEVCVTEGWE